MRYAKSCLSWAASLLALSLAASSFSSVSHGAVIQPADNNLVQRPGCEKPASLRTEPRIRQWADPDRDVPEGAEYRTFHSPIAKSEVSYVISLPPSYPASTSKRFPVVYLLQGSGNSPASTARCSVPLYRSLMKQGKIPEFIMVFPNGLNDLMFVNTFDGKFPNEDVIIKNLIPYIDANYRTIPTRPARAIGGYSMGGYGAAHLGFGYPDLFGAVTIGDGALWNKDEVAPRLFSLAYGSDRDYYDRNDPSNLVDLNAGKIRGRTFIQILEGSKDPLFPTDERFHRHLNQLGIANDFTVFEGLGHGEGAKGDPEKRPDLLGQYLFYRKAFAGVAEVRNATPVRSQ